jgi:PKD repeat protein
VDVDGGASTDDDQITSYSWSFGDGSSASGESASHTYNSGGTYTIELEVTDNDGATDTITNDITVSSGTPVSEDEWCQDNTGSDAVSEGNDNVDAGCKSQTELLGDPGSRYYGRDYPDIPCADDYAYLCEK